MVLGFQMPMVLMVKTVRRWAFKPNIEKQNDVVQEATNSREKSFGRRGRRNLENKVKGCDEEPMFQRNLQLKLMFF